jgi:hypothetical protein
MANHFNQLELEIFIITFSEISLLIEIIDLKNILYSVILIIVEKSSFLKYILSINFSSRQTKVIIHLFFVSKLSTFSIIFNNKKSDILGLGLKNII